MKKIFFLALLASTAVQAQKSLYDFGAKGDGTDETSVIQKAINASVGQTLVVPNDTFLCKDLYGVNKLKLLGQTGAYMKMHMIRFQGYDSVSISNIIFEGYNTYPASTTLLQVLTCKNLVVNKCTYKDNFAEAIALNNSTNCKITNNTILRTDVGVLTNGNCSNLEIAYNYIDGGTSDGVAIFGKEGTVDSNIVVHSNRVFNKTQGSGYLNWWAKNIEYKSNYAENCNRGFRVDETGYSPPSLKVLNNTFRRCNAGVDLVGNNSVVSGNIIDSSAGYGMWIGSQMSNASITYNDTISKNIIINTTDGIRLILTNKCVASENIISDTRPTKITYAGITIMQGTDNAILNNICLDATFPYHVNQAVNTYLSGNRGGVLNQGTGTVIK